MARLATAMGLAVIALVALGCGGGDDDGRTEPTTGMPVADGRCKPDPQAAAEREGEVEDGELSSKQAGIDEITEVRTCEIERNALAFKQRVCDIDVGEKRLAGEIGESEAKRIEAMQERLEC